MGGLFLASLLTIAGIPAGQVTPPAPPPATAENGALRNRLFVSPMGEPFRSAAGEPDPQDLWFRQADANHDGVLTLDEFTKDAMRFFAVLDRGHDGEIDPDDIEYYESTLLPEIRVDAAPDDSSGDSDSGDDSEAKPSAPSREGKRGAARYSYFDYPEPVMVADTNFNRGVDIYEFQRAAATRFALLDVNHDGKIERSELPRISTEKTGPSHEKARHHR